MNNTPVAFTFTDVTLPMSVRALHLIIFLLGCVWVGMGLYTGLTFFQYVQSVDSSYFNITAFLIVVLVYLQCVLGIGLLRRRKWVLGILGLHIFVTLFTLFVVLPLVGLQSLILPSLYGLGLTYMPMFALLYYWRSHLIGKANRTWINISYFLAIVSVAAINTVLQLLQI